VVDSIVFENVNIGRHTKIKKAIIDKNLVIPDNTTIGYDHAADAARGFTVTESGIVLVSTQESLK
jgi:glucose-1-phosphate adenylyltransferase